MPITEDLSIFLTRVYEGASSAPIFSVAAEGVSARIEGQRKSTVRKEGYSFIMMDGRPINWLDSKGSCWPKAKISEGVRIEGKKVYYIGENGLRCELNMSGGTNHGPNKQPRIARLGYLVQK